MGAGTIWPERRFCRSLLVLTSSTGRVPVRGLVSLKTLARDELSTAPRAAFDVAARVRHPAARPDHRYSPGSGGTSPCPELTEQTRHQSGRIGGDVPALARDRVLTRPRRHRA